MKVTIEFPNGDEDRKEAQYDYMKQIVSAAISWGRVFAPNGGVSIKYEMKQEGKKGESKFL